MTINVSGMGITASNSRSAADYLSINERRNQSPVGKVDAVKSATSAEAQNVAEEARQRYVAKTSPTSTIGTKSAGQVAQQTFQLMKQNTEATSKIAAELSVSKREPYISSENETGESSNTVAATEGGNTVVAVNNTVAEESEEEETTTSVSSPKSLTSYSEYELRKMVTDGAITSAELDAELRSRESDEESISATNAESAQSFAMRNALAAYNYQMSYQINAMAVQ